MVENKTNLNDLSEINNRWHDMTDGFCEEDLSASPSMTILEYAQFAKFFIVAGRNKKDTNINEAINSYFANYDDYSASVLSSLLYREAEHFFNYGATHKR